MQIFSNDIEVQLILDMVADCTSSHYAVDQLLDNLYLEGFDLDDLDIGLIFVVYLFHMSYHTKQRLKNTFKNFEDKYMQKPEIKISGYLILP